MEERIYPSNKTTQPQNGVVPSNTHFPPSTKTQALNGAARQPQYHRLQQPPPVHHPRRRSCCCTCCLWLTFLAVALLLLLAIFAAVFYVLYRPQRPTFSVTSFRIARFNVTSSPSNRFYFNANLTMAVRNPNKKIGFVYDFMDVLVISDGVDLGNGSFAAVVVGAKNVTTLKTLVSNTAGEVIDDGTANKLKSDLKKKRVFEFRVQLDTKAKVKIGKMKMKKAKIRVSCDKITGPAPTGKSVTTAKVSDSKCEVHLRIKIFKWTF